MRYLLLFVLLAFSFGPLTAQDAAPAATSVFTDHPARVVGNINGLNVRSSPAIETDNIVGRLQPGQQVHVPRPRGRLAAGAQRKWPARLGAQRLLDRPAAHGSWGRRACFAFRMNSSIHRFW